MKKFLTGTLFLMSSLFVFSQAYTPLISPGKTWKIELYGWGTQHLTYTFGASVEIGDQVYYPIMSENADSPGTLYPIDYIREDISTKKIYVQTGESEALLYDFDVVQDQVISVYAFGSMREITITSVGSVIVNGESRIDIHFTDMGVDGQWISGMGSIYGVPDATLGGIADYWPVVTCFYEDGDLAWDSPQDKSDCDATLGVGEEQKISNVSFWPNPANQDLWLSTDPRIAGQSMLISIVSADGREVYREKTFASDRTVVRLPLLSAGFYVLRLFVDNEIIHQGKMEIAGK